MRIFVFALAPSSISLSKFATTDGTLPLGVMELVDESLGSTSEKTSSGGRPDGAKVTVLLSFVSSFSRAAIL